MHYRMHIRTHAVDQQVHSQLTRDIAAAVQFVPVLVNDHQIVARHHAFAHACRGDQDALGVEPDGDIAVHGNHESAIVERLAYANDFVPMLTFRFHHAVIPDAGAISPVEWEGQLTPLTITK